MDGPRRSNRSSERGPPAILSQAACAKRAQSSCIPGRAQDLMLQRGRKPAIRAHAFRLEPDEQHHLAVAQLVIFGDDVKLIGVERRQALEIAGPVLESFEIVAPEIVVFGVHLLDRGEDRAERFADDRRRYRPVVAVIGGAVFLDERTELLRSALQSRQPNQRGTKQGAGGDLEPDGHNGHDNILPPREPGPGAAPFTRIRSRSGAIAETPRLRLTLGAKYCAPGEAPGNINQTSGGSCGR